MREKDTTPNLDSLCIVYFAEELLFSEKTWGVVVQQGVTDGAAQAVRVPRPEKRFKNPFYFRIFKIFATKNYLV